MKRKMTFNFESFFSLTNKHSDKMSEFLTRPNKQGNTILFHP